MKRVLSVLISLLILFGLFAVSCGSTDNTSSSSDSQTSSEKIEELYDVLPSFKYTFKNLGNTVYPIGAWMSPPYENDVTPIANNYITEAAYKDIADSGINAIYALYDKCNSLSPLSDVKNQKVLKAIDYAGQNNIVYLVRDENALIFAENGAGADKAADFYAELATHSGFGGALIQDEPNEMIFEVLGEVFKNGEIFKNYTPYVNLFPEYASYNQLFGTDGTMTADSYSKYVENFVKEVMPPFISYDYYGFGDGWFNNMSIVRNISKKYGIPFWTFIQVCSFGGGYKKCSQTEINYQVATSLAYGAKGIQYFTYWTPYDDAGTSPSFYPSQSDETINAMVSHLGEKQANYYAVQNTNRQIKAAGEILIDCGFAGLMTAGAASLPSADVITEYRQVESLSGKNAIMGCFDYFGKTVLYVVNNTLDKTADKITLTLKNENSGFTISEGQRQTAQGKTFEFNLCGGDSVLVLLDRK